MIGARRKKWGPHPLERDGPLAKSQKWEETSPRKKTGKKFGRASCKKIGQGWILWEECKISGGGSRTDLLGLPERKGGGFQGGVGVEIPSAGPGTTSCTQFI